MHLTMLWLPILLTTVALFVVSAIIWMAMPHHKSDLEGVEDEDGFMDAIRKFVGVEPGYYYFPFAKWEQAAQEEYRAKLKAGPVGILRVRNPDAVVSMGPSLVKAFLQYLGTTILIAFLVSGAVHPGEDPWIVFHTAGLAAFLAYGLIGVQDSIWFGLPRSVAFKHALDGFVYALVTGGIFAWLWPIA